MYPDRLQEKTRRYFSVAGDVTTNEKGLTSMRTESLMKKRMVHIRKGSFIQMMITKLIKKRCLWISFGINDHQTFLRVDGHEDRWFKMDLTKVFTLD